MTNYYYNSNTADPATSYEMSRIATAAKLILSRIELFSKAVIQIPLRPYQLKPLNHIIPSILSAEGNEYLIIFPRQSGKNEAVAHLLVYLLNLFQRKGGQIVYAAIADGLGRGLQRLEERLNNKWNANQWKKQSRPTKRILGKAAVVFLSSHIQAQARGETAHWLLVIDELQEQDPNHIEAVFTPMRAANNATALYIGTVRLTTDLLWTKKQQLERETAKDGKQRVFIIGPEQVIADNPAYGQFLKAQVRRHGRDHPIIASEYYLQPIDGAGGLFPARRQALMRGTHARQRTPLPDAVYIATIDIGGQDEASTDPLAQLDNPARDYTAATIFQAVMPQQTAPGPTYLALDVFIDHGSRHFQDTPGQPSLIKRLTAWLETWQPAHLFVDATGVGQGIADWLQAIYPERVTTFPFQQPGKKAALGSNFISLIETGRFKYWSDDAETPLTDGWWFWQQVNACSYELPPNGRFDQHLRWQVHASHKTSTPTGTEETHDDRLLSAALIANADELYHRGKLRMGQAKSAIIRPQDPLQDLRF